VRVHSPFVAATSPPTEGLSLPHTSLMFNRNDGSTFQQDFTTSQIDSANEGSRIPSVGQGGRSLLTTMRSVRSPSSFVSAYGLVLVRT